MRPAPLLGLAAAITLALPAAPPGAITTAAGGPAAGGPAPPRVTTQAVGGSALLFAVHAVSERVVWASGTGGTVLRTTDGGTTWTRRPVPGGDSLQFRDVHAFGADTAFVLAIGNGDASRIYRTLDGGASWTETFRNADPEAFYDCFTFPDARTGIVYGDAAGGRTHVLRSTDGGRSWALLPERAVPAPLAGEGAYAASGRCVVHGDARTVYIATGGPGSRLFVSTDAGATFTARETPFARAASAGTSGLAFRDARTGIGVAGDMANLRGDTLAAVVAVTGDGGVSWQRRPRPPLPGALTGVTWVPGAGAETIVAAGFGGVFTSDDGGRHWQVITDAGHAGLDAFGRTAWVGGRGVVTRLDW
jgi:photosystem II stability/assembly factor-like uncharacterized protein